MHGEGAQAGDSMATREDYMGKTCNAGMGMHGGANAVHRGRWE